MKTEQYKKFTWSGYSPVKEYERQQKSVFANC